MKKLLIAGLVVLVAAGMLVTGVVFAQGPQPTQTPAAPGYGGGMMGGNRGNGPMHDYVEQALAQKLGLTEAQIEEQLAAGKNMYQIVQDTGVAVADIPALLQEVHKTAFASAVAAGVLTQEQADAMLARMQNRWENGGMPCMNGGQPGSGMGGGHGRGGRGGPNS